MWIRKDVLVVNFFSPAQFYFHSRHPYGNHYYESLAQSEAAGWSMIALMAVTGQKLFRLGFQWHRRRRSLTHSLWWSSNRTGEQWKKTLRWIVRITWNRTTKVSFVSDVSSTVIKESNDTDYQPEDEEVDDEEWDSDEHNTCDQHFNENRRCFLVYGNQLLLLLQHCMKCGARVDLSTVIN